MELKRIRQLISLMKKNNISELELEESGFKVKLKTNMPSAVPTVLTPEITQSMPYYTSLPAPPQQKTEVAGNENLKTVKSPMVGTCYRSPAPDKSAYVEEGEMVKQGQILCLVEAMKLMNEIESPYDGKLVSVLVKNAQPVEYDEPLFLIET